jgi:DNA-binding LacI/PurR family transcriptional regulator
VAVIGDGDLPGAAATDPLLTSFADPVEQMAARMVAMLLARIGGAGPADMQETTTGTLIPRASEGPAPGSVGSDPTLRCDARLGADDISG